MKVIQIKLPKAHLDGHHTIEYGIVHGAIGASYGNVCWYCDTNKAIYVISKDSIEQISTFVLGVTPPGIEKYTFSEFEFPEKQPYLPEDTLQWLQDKHNTEQKAFDDLKNFL